MTTIAMEHCPRYDRCNAPRCPLDPHWRDRTHLVGEAVCAFLLEAAKEGAGGRFKGSPAGLIVQVATQMLGEEEDLGTSIRYAIRRAAKSKSRVELGRALNQLEKAVV
jgi:hypothetical protein